MSERRKDALYENPFVTRIQQVDVPLCETCQSCLASEVCGGGYIPHRYSSEVRGVLRPGFENPTIYCDAIYGLVEHAYHRVRASLPANWLEQSAQAYDQQLETAEAV